MVISTLTAILSPYKIKSSFNKLIKHCYITNRYSSSRYRNTGIETAKTHVGEGYWVKFHTNTILHNSSSYTRETIFLSFFNIAIFYFCVNMSGGFDKLTPPFSNHSAMVSFIILCIFIWLFPFD